MGNEQNHFEAFAGASVGEFELDVILDFVPRETTGRSCLEKFFNEELGTSGIPHLAMGTAGFPCTTVIGGTERVTTLPAVTTAPRPTTTPGSMIAPGPTKTSRSIFTPVVSRKCATMVTRILRVQLSSSVIRTGREVSRMTSYPIQTFLPILTPRARCILARRLLAPGKILAQCCRTRFANPRSGPSFMNVLSLGCRIGTANIITKRFEGIQIR